MTAIFDPNRCACIDTVGSTKIWRGNLPLNRNGDFSYHEMSMTLDLGPGESLIDVSLIDNVQGSERDQWATELSTYGIGQDFFPSGPTIPPQFNQPDWNPAQLLGDGIHLKNGTKAPGKLVWWQIEGGHDGIVLGPAVQSYNFIGLIDYLGVLRKIPDSVIYFHCMNGTDRTGAVVAAYAITYLDMDLPQAMSLANSLKPAGTMNPDYVALVQAYWEWFGHLDFHDGSDTQG